MIQNEVVKNDFLPGESQMATKQGIAKCTNEKYL